jgi:signal transduction histidine kinase
MVGMVDLLRGMALSEEQQRYTALAKESADLLLGVINDILDFSKLEAGRLSPECLDFGVKYLIEGFVSFMAADGCDHRPAVRDSGGRRQPYHRDVDFEPVAQASATYPSWR